jgi:hypothetical protein
VIRFRASQVVQPLPFRSSYFDLFARDKPESPSAAVSQSDLRADVPVLPAASKIPMLASPIAQAPLRQTVRGPPSVELEERSEGVTGFELIGSDRDKGPACAGGNQVDAIVYADERKQAPDKREHGPAKREDTAAASIDERRDNPVRIAAQQLSGLRSRLEVPPSPGTDVAGRAPVPVQMLEGRAPVPVQMWPRCRPVSAQMWQGASTVPVQMLEGRAQSRCRCGRDEPSPGADVGGVSPDGPVTQLVSGVLRISPLSRTDLSRSCWSAGSGVGALGAPGAAAGDCRARCRLDGGGASTAR